MAGKNAATVSKKWVRNLSNATQDMKDAVNAVDKNPAEGAIARKDEMKQKLVAAIDDGSWEAGLRKTTLADWKTDMIEKGIPRVAGGAQKAEGKMTAFLTDFLPVADQVSQAVKQMPNLTEEDSIARSAYAIRAFRAYGKRRR